MSHHPCNALQLRMQTRLAEALRLLAFLIIGIGLITVPPLIFG